jgi:hypothetical protein
MKKIAFALFAASLSLSTIAVSQTTPSTQTLPVSQLHAGMRGVAYTVFEGVKPEPMEVEILGVLHNVNVLRATLFWCACTGKKWSIRAWSRA